jgi:hypothetical protein
MNTNWVMTAAVEAISTVTSLPASAPLTNYILQSGVAYAPIVAARFNNH